MQKALKDGCKCFYWAPAYLISSIMTSQGYYAYLSLS